MPDRILQYSGSVLRIFVLGIAFVIGVGFVLTHTRVGRDALRSQFESWFNDRYAGELRIGRLDGNLVQTLYARDVHLAAPSGERVASIDSVVVRPSWLSLFNRVFSVRSIELYHPDITLALDGLQSLNIVEALRTVKPDSNSVEEPWKFVSADVIVASGVVRTRNTGARPVPVQRHDVFDYTNAEVSDISLQGTVDVGSDFKLVDLISFSGTVDDPSETIHARGQAVLEGSRLTLSAFQLQIGESDFGFNGAVRGFNPFSDLTIEEVADIELNLDILPSRLRMADLTPFFPVLPFADEFTLRASLSGPLHSLQIATLAATRRNSTVALDGHIRGLPDTLAYELSFEESRIESVDLKALVPELAPERVEAISSLSFDGEMYGYVAVDHVVGERRAWSAGGDLVLDSPAGTGTVSGEIERAGPAWTFEGAAEAASLDLSRVLNRPGWQSNLNGDMRFQGAGSSGFKTARAYVNLNRSTVSRRRVDLLSAEILLDGSEWNAEFAAYEDDTVVRASGWLDTDTLASQYTLTADVTSLDLERLLLAERYRTDLDAALTLEGSGNRLDEMVLEGVLETTGGSIGRGEDRLQDVATFTRFAFGPSGADLTRLTLDGDLLEMELSSDARPASLLALARFWHGAVKTAVMTQYGKSLSSERGQAVAAAYPPVTLESEAATRNGHGLAALSAGTVIDLSLKRPEPLLALWPEQAASLSGFDARLEALASADTLILSASGRLGSLLSKRARADTLLLDINVSTGNGAQMLGSAEADVRARGSDVSLRAQAFDTLSLSMDYERLRAAILVNGRLTDRPGGLLVDSNFYLLSDRNRLTLNRFELGSDAYVWQNSRRSTFDFHGGALRFRNVLFENRPPAEALSREPVQRLGISGALSDAPGDSLRISAADIQIEPLLSLVQDRITIGGALTSELTISGRQRSTEIVGDIAVGDLSFNGRNAGMLSVSSRYAPGANEAIVVRADLVQTRPEGPDIENNRLSIDGSLRLPGTDAGMLDLDVRFERLDLFFFDLIWSTLLHETEGYATGQGHIGGDFDYPLFDGDFKGNDLFTRIPAFNLEYQADGPFYIDETGIHLENVQVLDGTGGTGEVSGDILFNRYEYFSYNLAGTIDNLLIMNVDDYSADLPFYGTIRSSGSFTLDGPVYNAMLRSADAVTNVDSEMYIPVTEFVEEQDAGFIIMADSTGRFPELDSLIRRRNVVARRPEGERRFVDGLEMNLNVFAPEGSTVHLVFDPVLGDAVNAVGSGRIQLQRTNGDISTFGTFNITSGDYLFTATQMFVRRFLLEPGGTITWDGNPIDGALEIPAQYRTRASLAGLPGFSPEQYETLPFLINMNITGRVTEPLVDLSIELDTDDRLSGGINESIEPLLNRSDLTAEYATSVLLTNTFLLTTSQTASIGGTADDLLFNSLSQLVASQLNRFISEVVSNLDVNVGLQQGASLDELDVSYGFALRLLDQRVVIRGEGVYRRYQQRSTTEGINGELAVELRLNPNVILEVFYRRENDILNLATSLGNAYGAGLVYQTEFPNWPAFLNRLRGDSQTIRDSLDMRVPSDSTALGFPTSSESGQ